MKLLPMHIEMLKKISDMNGLESTDGLDMECFKELMDVGFVKGIDASSCDGDEYLNPKITVLGRQYLN